MISNIEQKGYFTNVLLKMNSKMGGTNHTLAERVPSKFGPTLEAEDEDSPPSFQQPPRSLSWLFEEPCMVVVSQLAEFQSLQERETTILLLRRALT